MDVLMGKTVIVAIPEFCIHYYLTSRILVEAYRMLYNFLQSVDIHNRTP